MTYIARRIIYLNNDPDGYIDIFIRDKSIFHINIDLFSIDTDCCTTTINIDIVCGPCDYDLNDQIQAIKKTIWIMFASRNATYIDSNESYDVNMEFSKDVCHGFFILHNELKFYFDDLKILEKLSIYNSSLSISRYYYKSEIEMMNHCYDGRIIVNLTQDELNINIYNDGMKIKRITNININNKEDLYEIISYIFETLCPDNYIYHDSINYYFTFSKTNLMYIFSLRSWKYPNIAWNLMPNTIQTGNIVKKSIILFIKFHQ